MEKKNTPASEQSTNRYEDLEDWARSQVQVWLQELLEDEVTASERRIPSSRPLPPFATEPSDPGVA